MNPVLQFSKERHVMDRTPERLKKELEEELLLSSEDLRSHAWYHGRIPRQVPASSLRAHTACSQTTPRPVTARSHQGHVGRSPGLARNKSCDVAGCDNAGLSLRTPWEELRSENQSTFPRAQ